jgi:hypothetical protein
VGVTPTASFSLTNTAPAASLSPTSLGFGDELIKTKSIARKVTLTSTGSTNLIISNVTFSGADPRDFAQTNNCPSSMAPGAKCTISVTFTPGLVGAESATLNVNDNAANSPQTVTLSGTGLAPATLTPASASFGNVAIHTASNPRTFTLKNNQSVPLDNITVSTNNTDFADSGTSGTTCGSSLAAKTSCTISVTLTPSVLGAEKATLTVNDDAPAPYNTLTSALSGAGVADVTLMPASHNFGNVAINTPSNAQTFTLRNNELATLSISGISVTSSNARDFAQTGGTCGASLAGQSSCTILVTLTPTMLGAETGSIRVTDNAAAPYNSLSATLSGTGVAQATVSPASLTFARQTVNTTSAAKNVTLTNDLSTALSIGTPTFTGVNAGDFFIQTNACPGSLAAKSQCTISVAFKPTGTGTRTATLNVNDGANNSPQTVSLTGTGK